MKKVTMGSFEIVCIFLILCIGGLVALASAENNSTTELINVTNSTTNITNITKILPVPEQFYGYIKYSDGTPVEAGRQIRALDQNGNVIGVFNMTENGTYGDSYGSAPRLIVNAETEDTVISFYLDDIKSTKTMKFDSAGIKRADISIPSVFKPTPVPTTIPTTEPTTEPTPKPTPVIVPTTTTVPPTTIDTPTPEPTKVPTESNDNLFKFIGVLLIALGICVIGAILAYYLMTKKMKREDEEEINLDYK